MENHKRNIYIYLPIFLSIVLAGGILLGVQLQKRQTPAYQGSFIPKMDKITGIINFIESDYVDSVSREDLEETAIPELLKQLDPHSIYIPARDVTRVNEPLEGNFEGIGVSFNMPNDTVVIVSVIKGGPSEKVGIQAGDRIIEIEDSVVAGVQMDQNAIVRKLKGPRGTKVDIGIERKSIPELIDFTITRDKIPLYSIDAAYMVNDSIGYIKITTFARTTYREFLETLEDLQPKGMKHMILDLRGNSGGYMDAATNLANQFLPEGSLIVYTEGRSHPRENYFANGNGRFQEGGVLVLIDEWSASASEIIAGAIQDNDRGIIMGRRSFGKGLVQEPLLLNDGSMIRLTIARYYTPTGRCIQKPYEDGADDYYHDLRDRYQNGELESIDSIQFADSLKYTTPKGKIVYGGGGIMPDLFVPVDTTGITPYFRQLRIRGLIYRFAFEYTDKNREKLARYTTSKDMDVYLESQNLLENFVRYASSQGIHPDEGDLQESSFIIHTEIKAYVARNMLDNKGFYPIWQDLDYTLKEAIRYMSTPG